MMAVKEKIKNTLIFMLILNEDNRSFRRIIKDENVLFYLNAMEFLKLFKKDKGEEILKLCRKIAEITIEEYEKEGKLNSLLEIIFTAFLQMKSNRIEANINWGIKYPREVILKRVKKKIEMDKKKINPKEIIKEITKRKLRGEENLTLLKYLADNVKKFYEDLEDLLNFYVEENEEEELIETIKEVLATLIWSSKKRVLKHLFKISVNPHHFYKIRDLKENYNEYLVSRRIAEHIADYLINETLRLLKDKEKKSFIRKAINVIFQNIRKVKFENRLPFGYIIEKMDTKENSKIPRKIIEKEIERLKEEFEKEYNKNKSLIIKAKLHPEDRSKEELQIEEIFKIFERFLKDLEKLKNYL